MASTTRNREMVRPHEIPARIVSYVVLTVGALFMLMPLLWQISTSLKSLGDVFIYPPKWIPDPIHWENYIEVFRLAPFERLTLNTVIVTVSNIIGYLLSCTVIAYAFARLRARGKNILFLMVLSTMMLPAQVTMIPLFAFYRSLGWIDTFLPLVVPSFFGNAFLIFMLRQFFMTIPRELDDAAKLDGCSQLQILWHVILPVSRPALATVATYGFIWHWNDFLWPLIFLSSEQNKTLQLGLATFLQQVYGVGQWELLMAASTIVMLPPVLLFLFTQRFYLEGITLTGIKG